MMTWFSDKMMIFNVMNMWFHDKLAQKNGDTFLDRHE